MRAGVMTIALLASCSHGPSAPAAPASPGRVTLAVVGATVIHPNGQSDPDQTILVAGERIAVVGPGLQVPAGVETVDAHGAWVIPGLIDSHVHFFQSGNPFTRPDIVDFTKTVPYAEEVRRNEARLPATFKVWLASGVVGVADVGGPMWSFEVRDAAAHADPAPFVKVAGPLVSLVERPALALDDPPIIEVSTPDEARALTRRILERRPDWVKMWFIHKPEGDLGAEEAIARAAADEAHRAGVRFIVHATELAVAKAALRAGADVLVHSVMDAPVDDEFLELARRRSVIYIPTLWVLSGYGVTLSGRFEATEAERRLADPEVLAVMNKIPSLDEDAAERATPPAAMANLARVHAAGIRVAMGTDAGNIGTLHGPSIFREMELMAQAGLTPAQVLESATVNGAAMLAMEADLGDVAASKLAELVILDADPLADVKNLARIRRVVHRGRVLDPDALIRSLR